jgi:hypothetical protein
MEDVRDEILQSLFGLFVAVLDAWGLWMRVGREVSGSKANASRGSRD